MTQYIVTRWYRAPEILLGCDMYTEAVDMWGLGCILGEMLQQRPLFPGKDYISQVRRILDYVGRPDGLDFVTNARAKKFVQSLKLATPLVDDSDAFFPKESASIRYLLRQMLALCPSKRITCEAALSHKFFVPVRNEASEKAAPRKLIWDRIDDVELTKNNLQCLVYKIFDEILVNAADNKQRDPDMDRMDVTIDAEANTISVKNNGKGIPVEMHKEHKVSFML